MFSRIFIERPIMATVIALVIVIAAAARRLAVRPMVVAAVSTAVVMIRTVPWRTVGEIVTRPAFWSGIPDPAGGLT